MHFPDGDLDWPSDLMVLNAPITPPDALTKTCRCVSSCSESCCELGLMTASPLINANLQILRLSFNLSDFIPLNCYGCIVAAETYHLWCHPVAFNYYRATYLNLGIRYCRRGCPTTAKGGNCCRSCDRCGIRCGLRS